MDYIFNIYSFLQIKNFYGLIFVIHKVNVIKVKREINENKVRSKGTNTAQSSIVSRKNNGKESM